ncbi:MAG TPA: peptidylprolyl isomerase [Terrimicrobiaceae bacterium]|jgi:peptidyl-prolyl cis-trans isomerase SurA|nr:peptidylprolyl isomerase [Terrimicrobiaceae bacterium]
MTRAAVFLALTFLLAGKALTERVEVIDGIAAIVNNDVVTLSQVRDLIGARERSLREIYRGAELENKLKEMRLSAIKDLIDRQLILQEFRKLQEKGAAIPDYVADDRIQAIIRQEFGGDRAAFVRTLQAQGYTLTQFRELEKEKIVIQAMRQQKVDNNFVISPTQIQAYYEKNRQAYATPEQVKLRMIVIREGSSSDIPDIGSKKELAEEIRDKVAKGAEFDRMAEMYSEDETTQQVGGDWGWIERNTLNEKLTNVAFSMRPGEVSPVIGIDNTYYIIMVEAKRNATIKPIGDVRNEIEKNLIQQERTKAQERWLDTLRQKAYIKILS